MFIKKIVIYINENYLLFIIILIVYVLLNKHIEDFTLYQINKIHFVPLKIVAIY